MAPRGLPSPDLSRFSRIEPAFVVQAYLATAKSSLTLKQLEQRLRALLPTKVVGREIEAMLEEGVVEEQGNRLHLSESARHKLLGALGADANSSFASIRDQRLPILALGFDPDDGKLRKQLGNLTYLQSKIIAVAFGLQNSLKLTSAAVRSELVWRVLRGALDDLIGHGPFDEIRASNVVDRTIIASLAGTEAKRIDTAVGALAANTLSINKSDADSLKARLVEIALQITKGPEPIPLSGDFAKRVISVATGLRTPPFRGRVAIAQVYDEYGRLHGDAGSLASFKDRLVESAKARELNLSRLDLPQHMSRDLRERSLTKWGSDEVHFVVTE